MNYPINRRRHALEFKCRLVALCQPGISVSAVALAHGVNANLLRRWIRQFSAELSSKTILPPSKLVPVQVDMLPEVPASDAIEINIQKNSARINIRWPGNQANVCSLWLNEWLK